MPDQPAAMQEALERFAQLELFDAQLARTPETSVSRTLLEGSQKGAVETIGALCEDPELRQELVEIHELYSIDLENIAIVRNSGHVDEDAIKAKEAEFAKELEESPEARLAFRFAGYLGIQGATKESALTVAATTSDEAPVETEGPTAGTKPNKKAKASELDLETMDFFMQSAQDVGDSLMDGTKKIRHKNVTGKIVEVLVQDKTFNGKWVSTDPIWDEADRADAYVDKSQGNPALYLRAGEAKDGECVRIVKIEIDGTVYKNPSQVCKALGLTEKAVAGLQFDGKTVRVVGAKPWERVKK